MENVSEKTRMNNIELCKNIENQNKQHIYIYIYYRERVRERERAPTVVLSSGRERAPGGSNSYPPQYSQAERLQLFQTLPAPVGGSSQ